MSLLMATGQLPVGTQISFSQRPRFPHLFYILFFDPVHLLFPLEQISAEVRPNFPWNHKKLVVYHIPKGNLAAYRQQVLAPLINESGIPHRQQNYHSSGGHKCPRAIMKIKTQTYEQQSKSKNKNGRQRNQKAVSERGHAIPVGVACDYIIKSSGPHSQ